MSGDTTFLLQFYGSRRFARKIEHYAVDALNFVDNAVHAGLKYLERYVAAFCGHEVAGVDGAKYNSVVVGAEIAHNAY